MVLKGIKGLIHRLFGSDSKALTPSNLAPESALLKSIHETLSRINRDSSINPDMKVYANRLVDLHLKSMISSYNSCVVASDSSAMRLGRSIESINNDIMSYIEACLIDIEFGAIFQDNLSDVFLTCLLDFERQIESRIAC